VNRDGVCSSVFGNPSNQTATTPGVARGGNTQTRVLSLQRCVELAATSPNIQFRVIVGWKLAPSTVTSMPPWVGPVLGMRRWILGNCICMDCAVWLGSKNMNDIGWGKGDSIRFDECSALATGCGSGCLCWGSGLEKFTSGICTSEPWSRGVASESGDEVSEPCILWCKGGGCDGSGGSEQTTFWRLDDGVEALVVGRGE
jgi:hypothetical protein